MLPAGSSRTVEPACPLFLEKYQALVVFPLLLKLRPPKGNIIATTADWPRFLASEWRKKHRPIKAKKVAKHFWRREACEKS